MNATLEVTIAMIQSEHHVSTPMVHFPVFVRKTIAEMGEHVCVAYMFLIFPCYKKIEKTIKNNYFYSMDIQNCSVPQKSNSPAWITYANIVAVSLFHNLSNF